MLEWGPKSGGLVPILLDGEQVATVDPEFWREGAELEIGGRTWQFARDGRDRVARLQGSADPALRATRPSFFSSAWAVHGEGVGYEVRRASLFGNEHLVLREGTPVGTGRTASFWSGRATLDLDPSVPPVHQLFLLWISHLMRQRANAAAASG
ncbi:hypothetical protein [Ornithinimicrobium cavernae]|uniref:hypothetical protein n=1 Tax=Ornithinimicrobium cavernae TaxID=2666047 RepID=UPI000D6911B2|nr:hypothetical protein [Ornithinimicrobium cavernae]